MPSRWSARRTRFRGILAGGACVHPASVHDAVSARIAADLGFELGMFAGSVASLAVLGAPDLIVLTLSEFADQAYQRIGRAAELPLLVDADHGYGNALNVMRTVEELETAGVAALSIEDTDLPRGYGPSDKAELALPRGGRRQDEGRLGGAERPRPGDCRTHERHGHHRRRGCDRRAKAYEAAGVDAMFLVGIKTKEQLEAAAEHLRIPIILGGGAILGDRANLASKGVRVSLQGHQPFQAAVRAIHDTLKALRDGTAPADLKNLASNELMAKVTGSADYAGWTRNFLGGVGKG